MNSILIVEDERGIRETLRGVLADEGYEVETVETGEECLKSRSVTNSFYWLIPIKIRQEINLRRYRCRLRNKSLNFQPYNSQTCLCSL